MINTGMTADELGPSTGLPGGLSVSELEVRYGSFVLGPLNLEASGAAILCLLGPNGSGKTTLIRSVLGLQRPDRGIAVWNDEDLAARPASVFVRIGYVSDSPEDVIAELTPHEYWEYCAMAYTRFGCDIETMLTRADDLSRALDFIAPNRSISGFSLGMRRKTQLVAGMMHAPDFLVLDEPLIGLDFISIRALESVLKKERARGALVWMASHDLGVAGRLADHVIVLHLGRKILDGRVESLPGSGTLEDKVERTINVARGGFEPSLT